MVTKEEMVKAIQRIHELAVAYRGPKEAEFHELARRTDLSTEDNNVDPDGDAERLSPKSEDSDIKWIFEEALAMLFSLAFPATKATAQEIFDGLSSLLEQPISDAVIVGFDKPFRLKAQLKKKVPVRQQELYGYFKGLIPSEEEFNSEE
ncbi:hypothetical protein SAMN05216599_12074 [Pseudomonas cichorii]|nr:hypothetical protein SAMN05216599_12074 [Pseudomonas cichorii]